MNADCAADKPTLPISDAERRLADQQACEARVRELQDQLRQAEQARDDFLAVLSHELRNPIASIVMGLSLLEHQQLPEQARLTLKMISRQTSQMASLVDGLLDVTCLARNKVHLRREPVELNALILRVVSDYQAQFALKRVTLRTELADAPLRLDADPVRLTQMVGNLLHNALKFTKRGGVVNVRLSLQEPPLPAVRIPDPITEPGGHGAEPGNPDTDAARPAPQPAMPDSGAGKTDAEAVIEIADNGIGIEPALLSSLFEPFIQAEPGRERADGFAEGPAARGSLGLGLSIVKGLTELHGGRITASSEGPGKGARFTIRLPLPPAGRLPDGASQEAPPDLHPLRILIIDDNPDLAQIMIELFSLLGHEAFASSNGMQGVELARSRHPDVVFCDIGLPGLNGYETARMFRSDEALAGICLIAMSGFVQPEDSVRSRQAGFDWHLAKPVSLETLAAALDEIQARKR